MLEMSSDPQAVSIPKCTATGHRNFEMIEDEDDTTTNLWCTSSKRTTICRKMAQLLPNFAAVVDSRCKYSPLLEPQHQKQFFLKRIPPHPRILLLLLLASLMAFLLWNMIHFEEGIPPFNRWAFSNTTLDCARLMAHDTEYIAEMATQRIQFEDPPKLEMDCGEGIRWRNFFPDIESGEQYPLAQARIVYRDYVFLEMELASTYSPNNWYCYAIDVKADATFRSRMRQLAGCLPNVLILPQTWNFDSGGHNISRAHLTCLQLLTVPERGWKYVALLQNHDTAIKTNAQMKQIYQWLDGANDVEVTHLPAGRVSDTLDWSFEAIRMFKNESRNRKASASGFAQKLVFSKGYVQSSLTREMAEFMLNDLDLTALVQRLESGGFGIDEILVPTLHAADALQAPGGFTHACLEKDKRVQHITRASIWYDENACGSKHLRHHVCVFGLEDLPQHLAKWPHLFANKFQPDFDFGAALCWYEAMHNRSYLPAESERAMLSLSRAVYADLAHVRFQHFKALMAEQQTEIGGTNKMSYKQALQSFDCREEYDNLNGR